MQYYKVFCADCHMKYEQSGYKPVCCGGCGSDWIAVKPISAADMCGTILGDFFEAEDERDETLSDAGLG